MPHACQGILKTPARVWVGAGLRVISGLHWLDTEPFTDLCCDGRDADLPVVTPLDFGYDYAFASPQAGCCRDGV
jgi:hypothetical protein